MQDTQTHAIQWALPERWDTGDGFIRWASFGAGPPLVLLHGTPFSSTIWRDIVPALAQRHTVYVWDMLGFGQSESRAEDTSLTRQTEILAALLAHWGVHAPAVIAHDVGGVVALRAMLLHGVEFSALTLINAASVTGWGDGEFFRAVQGHPDVFTMLPPWAMDSLIEAKLRSASHTGLRADALRTYLAQWTRAGGREAFVRQYAQGGEEHSEELQPLLADITIPVHVIWGVEDAWLSVDYARQLLAALPLQTRLTLMPDAGHAVQEDQPGALLVALTEWRIA
ncbi:alpha/beta fold hydrolase [Leucobacter komagatae]|uniref:alpha/beta fold hydrolase n=1 Tax=Leucobacter komagatae TaxID=55969 RepID=UPI0005ACE4BB|nr:alpha/beta hydrolase [Leucobacter komagatae]